ncbi:S1 RNA-binding domain-containing protein [Vibrio sp. SM6]|uniref:S1 RNA-binding domain-containing protein n=1 Tax=Vibrio agarilyticus TaxID=2726741 RepID=A0A7X8TTB1_9VIBR|nr:S1 RNA-binding domain-containing protein [Vibrio agarilyticus]
MQGVTLNSVELFKKGSFFKAIITRVEPTLEAAFVDVGAERHGFLPLKNIEGYDKELHKEGSSLIVSIEIPEKGQKGAAVKAHKTVPNGITVHELELSYQEKKSTIGTAIFFSSAIILFGAIVYMNT